MAGCWRRFKAQPLQTTHNSAMSFRQKKGVLKEKLFIQDAFIQ